ncbi:nuclear transport factor 2 family protein [Actinocorallia populi]|uniref:nuclear transport factor 2 family protein n=1 Tax=Actinocorallia populi TaxID=2079200 RepID=UPI0013008972|nr:nuclear transport factor 2 family protein [Actinocorallia populi]
MPTPAIPVADVTELVSLWWFAYDQGDFATLRELLHEEVRFSSRSDTGDAPYEESIRCELTGADAVVSWQSSHRMVSPFPIRHFATNVHITGVEDGETRFSSYMFVTKNVNGAPKNLTSGIVSGSVVAGPRRPVLRSLEVVIDFMDALPRFPEGGETVLAGRPVSGTTANGNAGSA